MEDGQKRNTRIEGEGLGLAVESGEWAWYVEAEGGRWAWMAEKQRG